MKYIRNGSIIDVAFFHQEYVDRSGSTVALVNVSDPGQKPFVHGDLKAVSKEFGGQDTGLPIHCYEKAFDEIAQNPPKPDQANHITDDASTTRSKKQQDQIVDSIWKLGFELWGKQRAALIQPVLDAAKV